MTIKRNPAPQWPTKSTCNNKQTQNNIYALMYMYTTQYQIIHVHAHSRVKYTNTNKIDSREKRVFRFVFLSLVCLFHCMLIMATLYDKPNQIYYTNFDKHQKYIFDYKTYW